MESRYGNGNENECKRVKMESRSKLSKDCEAQEKCKMERESLWALRYM